jgi:RNA polymerase sigma-70 factor (ECF subfamily)
MKGICLRYAKTGFEAEDIFQEAFVKVFSNIQTFRDGNFNSWIRRIFVNAAINNYRNNKKHYDHSDSHDLEMSDSAQLSGLDELNTQDLVALINELPEGYRVVFNLHIVEGYNHKEIGEMLQIAEATSRSQLARAKGLLKKKLEKINSCKYAS